MKQSERYRSAFYWWIAAMLLVAASGRCGNSSTTGALCSDYPLSAPGSLVSEEVTRANAELATLRWPDAARIQDLRVPQVENSAIPLIAQEQLIRIIKPEAVPVNVVECLIPLRGAVNGCDAFLTRYKCGDFLVQVFVTTSHVRILARETVPNRGNKVADQLSLVRKVFETMFRDHEEILGIDFAAVPGKGGLVGTPPSFRGEIPGDGREPVWKDTLRWWTNGELIYVFVCTNPAAAQGGWDQPFWFARKLTEMAGIRGPFDPLTEEMKKAVYEK